MANRIPRTAKKLQVTALIKSNAHPIGAVFTVEKNDQGWTGELDGKRYFFFAEHLRNENYCKIKVIG